MKLSLNGMLSYLNSNLSLSLGYLNPALNNPAQGFKWNGEDDNDDGEDDDEDDDDIHNNQQQPNSCKK